MSIFAELADDAIAILKTAGKEVETFVISEGQKLVAQVKQTYIGTAALNIIQAIESHDLTSEQKYETVVSSVVPLINSIIAGGGITGIVTSVEDFAREFVQSVYNDLKADLAKIAGASATLATDAAVPLAQAA